MNWFTRNLTWTSRKTEASNPQSQSNSKEEDEDQLYGVTEDLINYTKSFTIDTFKNFPLQYEDEATNAENSLTNSARIRNDLSQWQERHATLVLSRVKELSQIRYKLCPGRLKDNQFWSIYFKLVRSHVIEYELRAIQREKLKEMAVEEEKSLDNNAIEVEMSETKHGSMIESPHS
ncbi:uncharacterized protein LOC114753748 isoform X1 [Neltuma alba]|uniref:uncharacterized protein LOC114753748 isoform X1 n=1 Tax=Neltuma alba TaxID=207710 RepID=UPI0010A342CD|nr:uncharacterized protein LOC114753748 isoform X1 [Prosopis alba]